LEKRGLICFLDVVLQLVSKLATTITARKIAIAFFIWFSSIHPPVKILCSLTGRVYELFHIFLFKDGI